MVTVAAAALDAEHQAREHRLTVEQHGAGAALAKLAAVLGAAEVQVLTQHLEQRLVRRERDVGRLAVDGQRESIGRARWRWSEDGLSVASPATA